jgi:hypothetical protein
MSAALMRLPEARAALGVKSNQTLRAWCAKWDVPIISLNARAKAVQVAEFERSLLAAAAPQPAPAAATPKVA